MVKTEKLHFCKGDWLAIGLVAMLAAAVFACFLPVWDTPAGYAEIYLDGQLLHTLPLGESKTLLVEDQYSNEITIKDGAIAFAASNCPGQDCVHSGAIRSAGRSLVCLPNRVEIRVVGHASDVDFVVG